MGKYFGTDGIRGKNEKFTKEFVTNIVDSLLKSLNKNNLKILVGGDTRKSSETIIKDVCVALKLRGVQVLNTTVLPTPAISYLTKEMKCDCSIIVTASHNPSTDNGIKIINSEGEKLTDEFISKIEKYMDLEDNSYQTTSSGSIENIHDKCVALYTKKLLSCLDGEVQEINIGIDCANGATSEVAKSVYDSLNVNYIICCNNKTYNNDINKNCGSTHLENIAKLVKSKGLDYGVAYDGDGDRALFVDHEGNEIDGDHILAIFSEYLDIPKELVITVMANQGLLNYGKNNNIKMITTDVGDTNVYEEMKSQNIAIGGEQSGHIILRNYGMHTGDGILTSLILAGLVSKTKKSLKYLAAIISKYPQIIQNVPATSSEKAKFKNSPKISELLTKYESILEKNEEGRLNIRPSGTEDVIRITMWGKSRDGILKLASDMANELKRILED